MSGGSPPPLFFESKVCLGVAPSPSSSRSKVSGGTPPSSKSKVSWGNSPSPSSPRAKVSGNSPPPLLLREQRCLGVAPPPSSSRSKVSGGSPLPFFFESKGVWGEPSPPYSSRATGPIPFSLPKLFINVNRLHARRGGGLPPDTFALEEEGGGSYPQTPLI